VFLALLNAWRQVSSWRRLQMAAILGWAIFAILSLAILLDARQAVPSPVAVARAFLFLRSVNLGSGVSPLFPMRLLGGAVLILTLCALRRFNLLEECPLPVPFLNFGHGSFDGVAALEERISNLLMCGPFDLPGSRVILLPILLALGVALWRGRFSFP